MTSELRSALPGFRLRHSLTGDRSLAPQPSSVLGGRTYLGLTSFVSATRAAEMICNASAVCFSGTYILFNRGRRYIERSKYCASVKLPGMFKYNP